MSRSRPLLILAGLGLVGVALASAGAGATFLASGKSDQKVTAGTLQISVSAPGTACTSAAQHCAALTLPDVGPVGSTFESTPTYVTVTNTGDIPATYQSFQLSETHGANSASVALRNEMNVCLHSADPGYSPNTPNHSWVEGNGPLTIATGLNPTVQENPLVLNPGDTAIYWVDFYAGKDSSCGTTYSDGSHTRDAWAAAVGHGYETPASLNNDAMGGVVTPTVTFNFTG